MFLSDRCLRAPVLFGIVDEFKSFKDEIEIIESLSSATSYVGVARNTSFVDVFPFGFNPDRILFISTFCGPFISGRGWLKFEGGWGR